MDKSKRPVGVFIAVLAVTFLLYYVMTALQPGLSPIIFDYATWEQGMMTDPLYLFLWILGDFTEPPFFKAVFGGLFFLLGCIAAYLLDKNRSKYRGTPLCYGNGAMWPWIFLSGLAGIFFASLLYRTVRVEGDAWIGTFIPFVCVPSAIIFLYGPGIKNLLTGAILAAIFTTPISVFLRNDVCAPLGLPGLIGVVASMWIGGIICFQICAFLPWMKLPEPPAEQPAPPPPIPGEIPISEFKKKHANLFFIRRLFADFSEPMFIGNEIVGIALIAGSILTWLLNPMQPAYGSGLFPALLLSELLTGAISLFLYWNYWMEGDYFPSFTPIVSVAPTMVFVYGTSVPVIVISAILGAIMCPPLALMITNRLPSNWHPVIGNTASMTISVAMVAVFLRYVTAAFPFLLGA